MTQAAVQVGALKAEIKKLHGEIDTMRHEHREQQQDVAAMVREAEALQEVQRKTAERNAALQRALDSPRTARVRPCAHHCPSCGSMRSPQRPCSQARPSCGSTRSAARLPRVTARAALLAAALRG